MGKKRKGKVLRMEGGRVRQEDQEKWVTHYSSKHQILVVGDGDFSFSLCLARSFGYGFAQNIVATSLDTYENVTMKYKDAKANLINLEKLGAAVLHGVNATEMRLHPDLKMRKFDRIVFNFPHAGFYGREENKDMIGMHASVVRGFFRNANWMLRPNGEVHVSHKTGPPYRQWNIEELARVNLLELIECVDFKKEDYPGYQNKRGSGNRCDEKFSLANSFTFKFRLSAHAKNCEVTCHSDLLYERPQRVLQTATQLRQLAKPFNLRHPQTSFITSTNDFPTDMWSPLAFSARRESASTIDRYINHNLVIHRSAPNCMRYFASEAERHNREIYMTKGMGNFEHQCNLVKLHQPASVTLMHPQASIHMDTNPFDLVKLHQPASVTLMHPQASIHMDTNQFARSMGSFGMRRTSGINSSDKSFRHALEMQNRGGSHIDHITLQAQRYNDKSYIAEALGRIADGNLHMQRQHPNNSKETWRHYSLSN